MSGVQDLPETPQELLPVPTARFGVDENYQGGPWQRIGHPPAVVVVAVFGCKACWGYSGSPGFPE